MPSILHSDLPVVKVWGQDEAFRLVLTPVTVSYPPREGTVTFRDIAFSYTVGSFDLDTHAISVVDAAGEPADAPLRLSIRRSYAIPDSYFVIDDNHRIAIGDYRLRDYRSFINYTPIEVVATTKYGSVFESVNVYERNTDARVIDNTLREFGTYLWSNTGSLVFDEGSLFRHVRESLANWLSGKQPSNATCLLSIDDATPNPTRVAPELDLSWCSVNSSTGTAFPALLISPRHALIFQHAGWSVGRTFVFRDRAGQLQYPVVQARARIPEQDVGILYFDREVTNCAFAKIADASILQYTTPIRYMKNEWTPSFVETPEDIAESNYGYAFPAVILALNSMRFSNGVSVGTGRKFMIWGCSGLAQVTRSDGTLKVGPSVGEFYWPDFPELHHFTHYVHNEVRSPHIPRWSNSERTRGGDSGSPVFIPVQEQENGEYSCVLIMALFFASSGPCYSGFIDEINTLMNQMKSSSDTRVYALLHPDFSRFKNYGPYTPPASFGKVEEVNWKGPYDFEVAVSPIVTPIAAELITIDYRDHIGEIERFPGQANTFQVSVIDAERYDPFEYEIAESGRNLARINDEGLVSHIDVNRQRAGSVCVIVRNQNAARFVVESIGVDRISDELRTKSFKPGSLAHHVYSLMTGWVDGVQPSDASLLLHSSDSVANSNRIAPELDLSWCSVRATDTPSFPALLVSPRHALICKHAGMYVGRRFVFRDRDGNLQYPNVTRTAVPDPLNDVGILYFDREVTNCAIAKVLDSSIVDYIGDRQGYDEAESIEDFWRDYSHHYRFPAILLPINSLVFGSEQTVLIPSGRKFMYTSIGNFVQSISLFRPQKMRTEDFYHSTGEVIQRDFPTQFADDPKWGTVRGGDSGSPVFFPMREQGSSEVSCVLVSALFSGESGPNYLTYHDAINTHMNSMKDVTDTNTYALQRPNFAGFTNYA